MKIEDKIRKTHPELTPKQVKFIAKKVNQRLRSGKGVGGAFFSNLVDKVKSGVKSLVSTAKEGLKTVAGKVVEKGLEKATEAINKGKTDPHPEFDYKPKPGEKHQVLLKDGYSYRARWSGPGTKAIEDLHELLKMHNGSITEAIQEKNFASPVDLEAFAHDMRYMLSGGDKNKIRAADQKFISVLSKMTDANRLVPLAAMKAKVMAEDYKLTEVYGSEASHYSEADKKLMESALSALERKGYGMMVGIPRYGPSHPTIFRTGPVGYPHIMPDFPTHNSGYPPHYFDLGFYGNPELGHQAHPRPNRPPKTESYSVPIKMTNRVGNGQDDLYDFPTLQQQGPLPNAKGYYDGDQFISLDTEGPYIPSGVPIKDSYDYNANEPPKTQPYSVKIGDVSARKSYTGKGDQVTKEDLVLTGAGKKKGKKRSAGGNTNPWIKAVKDVQKRDGVSYKEAMVIAGKEYKK